MSNRTPNARSLGLPMVALSVVLHGGAWAAATRARPAPARERIEIEVVRRDRPAPRAPEPPRPPPPRPRVVLTRPQATPARPEPAPGAPAPALSSAPQTPPPPDAPRALPRVGISLGSTVSSGSFTVGVGNTLHGRASGIATEPASVRRHSGGVVAAARLSAQPKPLELPEIPYPPEARRAGVEGQVVLVLRLDATGAVRAARVVDAPSPELAHAAEEGARRFRFSPAILDGEPVETEIRFTYTFLLQ